MTKSIFCCIPVLLLLAPELASAGRAPIRTKIVPPPGDEFSVVEDFYGSGTFFDASGFVEIADHARPGRLLGEWMYPYESDRDAEVAALAPTLEAEFVTTSFDDNAGWDEFFTAEVSTYIAEMVVALPNGEDLIQTLIDDGCQAYVDEFGETTDENWPFDGFRRSAGVTNGCQMEVVTTLPLGYITKNQDSDYADTTVPTFALPLYQRYLTQHEFGHMVHINEWGTEFDGLPLAQTISDLFDDAKDDDLLMSCYSGEDEMEFWAEASAIYFSPLPVAALNGGPGNGGCDMGLTPEAEEAILNNRIRTGAELVENMQPELFELLNIVYDEALDFSIR